MRVVRPFGVTSGTHLSRGSITVMARIMARALINFAAPLLPALIRDLCLFETRHLLFLII